MINPIIFLLIFFTVFTLIYFSLFPNQNFLSSLIKKAANKDQILMEDALKAIQQCELGCHPATLQSVSGFLKISPDRTVKLLNKISDLNLVKVINDEIHLTSEGFDYALHLTRAHRLSEEYLAQETGWPLEDLHKYADRIEHGITAEELETLSSQLGNPLYDPHGDPIPTSTGKVKHLEDQQLTSALKNHTYIIVHLEDEPEEIFSQLSAEGLRPGMMIHITEKSQQKIRFWSDVGEHVLAPLIAANISVSPICQVEPSLEQNGLSLSDLLIGQSAEIKEISPYLRKIQRRRLMDLGFIPGTTIKAEMRSANGDPTAFRIRGSVIALRQDQTDKIKINKLHLAEARPIDGK